MRESYDGNLSINQVNGGQLFLALYMTCFSCKKEQMLTLRIWCQYWFYTLL